MSIQTFLKKENVDTLWDVIVDEDIFKFLSRDVQGKVFQIFVENIKGFYEIERKTSTNLIDVNKKYILLILNYIIRSKFPTKSKYLKMHLLRSLLPMKKYKTKKRANLKKIYNFVNKSLQMQWRFLCQKCRSFQINLLKDLLVKWIK